MDTRLVISLIVLLIYVVLMLSGKFHFSLIGITCVLILIVTGVLSISEGFAGFTDKNVVLLMGMFGMAGQLSKTSMIDKVKDRLLRTNGKQGNTKLAFTLLVIAATMAQFTTSQSSMIMILMSFLLVVANDELTISRILLPLTFVMTTWIGKLPIGGPGVTQYIMLNQFIEAAGGTDFLDVLSLTKCTLIPGIIAIIYSTFTYRILPKKDVDVSSFSGGKQGGSASLSPRDEMITYVAFIISVVGLLFANKIGSIAYILPFALCIILIYLKVMSGKEFLNLLTGGPIIMCATTLTIANAVTDSGAGNLIGEVVVKILGGNPTPVMIVTVFGIVALITTTFVLNTASFMVLVPIACSVCAAAGYDPRAAVVVVYSASILSVMTPMANTGSAIVYSCCNLDIKETIKWTLPGSLICLAATIINSIIVYPM